MLASVTSVNWRDIARVRAADHQRRWVADTVLDRGALALWPGIVQYSLAMLLTGLWEELVLHDVVAHHVSAMALMCGAGR